MSQESELINILLQGQARKTVDDAIMWAGDNPARFKIIVETMASNLDQPVRNRASWALSYIAENNPSLLKYHWPVFVKLLVDKKTSGPIKRNLVRFIQVVDIPEKFQGQVVNRCFELVTDPKEDIAIRAFSITVIANLLPSYPDMANELKLAINELIPHASPGLKNRAVSILKRMEKMK